MVGLQSYPAALVLCVITMLCWGSWANTRKLAGMQWRFELFYWDYVFGMVLLSLEAAFTLGSIGSQGRPFLLDVKQADLAMLGSVVLGGVVFNAANILLVAAIDIAGMAVAFPVGIGLALVVGVGVNYWGRPEGNVVLLFSGVALIAAAIILDALAYRRLPGQSRGVSTKGLVLSVLCGLLMGSFYWLVARAMSANPLVLEPGKLSPYTAVCYFAIGVLASNLLFNQIIMARPFRGPRVTWSDYFQGSARQHLLGLAGGAIWAVGMLCNVLAAGVASPAVSYGLGQGATLIAALWGVFVWREFRQASAGVKVLLALMFAAYFGGLTLLTTTKASSGETPGQSTQIAQEAAPEKTCPDMLYAPTPYEQVHKMLRLAEVKKDDVVYDLACGDGRTLVIAALKYGCHCEGYDIDPARVREAQRNVEDYEVEDLVRIEQQDIFEVDLSPAGVITLHLEPEMNARLIPQFEKLKPGSRLVANDNPIEGAKPDKLVTYTSQRDGLKHALYLYTTPLKME